MMRNFIKLGLLLGILFAPGMAQAQSIVRPCTTVDNTVNGCPVVSPTMPLPIGSGFNPTARAPDSSVTTSSSRVALGATAQTARICNTGSVTAYVALGDSSVVATTNGSTLVFASSCINMNVGSATYLAAITATSSTTLQTSLGTGIAALGGGGAGGGAPSGAAGGDLAGTYPNPTLAWISRGSGGALNIGYGSAVASNLYLGASTGNLTGTGIGNTGFGLNALSSLGAFTPTPPDNQGVTAFGYFAGNAVTTGDANTLIGYNAGKSITVGREMTVIGYRAGESYTTSGGGTEDGLSTYIGSFAGNKVTSGIKNVFIGQKAGLNVTTANGGVMIGNHAGTNVTTANNNVYIGANIGDAGTVGSTGTDNVMIGANAGNFYSGSTGFNIYIGSGTGAGTATTNTGSLNVGIGHMALPAITTAVQTIAIGYNAGNVLTSGNSNTLVGYQAGASLITGANNTFFGNGSGNGITGSNNIMLGTLSGRSAPAATANTFVAGSGGSSGNNRIDNVYFGKGIVDATPTGYSIRGTGGLGTDIAAGSVTIVGGLSTGAGTNPDIVFATGVKGASGTSAATQTTALTIKGETQTVVIASGKSLQLGNAYTAGAPTSTGYFKIVDSTGATVTVPGCLSGVGGCP